MKNFITEIYEDCVPDIIGAQREMNLYLISKAERMLNDHEDNKAISLLKQIIMNIESLKKQVPALVAVKKEEPKLHVLPLEMPKENVVKLGLPPESVTLCSIPLPLTHAGQQVFLEQPVKKKRNRSKKT
jgi:hypothetical protein